jgi:hypothetical protein
MLYSYVNLAFQLVREVFYKITTIESISSLILPV